MSENLIKASQRPRAVFVKDLPVTGREGSQLLWNVHGRFVVTSTSDVFGWETYVFPADSEGNITDWAELPGSFKGEANHTEALRGYLDSLETVCEASK